MSIESPIPTVPPHLAPTTAEWWQDIIDNFDLEPHHVRILTLAAEAWDRCATARESLQQNGLTYIDRFGAPRSRPEVAVERDSRVAFCRCMRELGLDIDAPRELRGRGVAGY